MPIAAEWPWVVDKGATLSQVFTMKNPDGTLMNLTGYTAKSQVRTNPGAALVLEMSTSNGRITLGGALGTITVLVPAATMSFDADLYQYDLELTSGTGTTRVIQGSFEVRDEITV